MKTSIEVRKPYYNKFSAACFKLYSTIVNNDVNDSVSNDIETAKTEMINNLNKIFEEKECLDIIITNNIDNIPFGIIVNPTITNMDLIGILVDDTTDVSCFTRYTVEIDSNLFTQLGLTADELAFYITYNIYAMTCTTTMDTIKEIIDLIVGSTNEDINIRNSVNYSQILIFGIKTTLFDMEDLLHIINKGDIVLNPLLTEFLGMDNANNTLHSIEDKAKTRYLDFDGGKTDPNLGTLKWAFMIYNDIDTYYKDATATLDDAVRLTGSQSVKDEIAKTIKSINKAAVEITAESASILNEAKKGSFFANLKQNGLRSIEDDYYEFSIRLKNCETQDDAMYILRQINSRIAILDDYLMNTELSDNERERWLNLIHKFRVLREELGKKKIGNKKQYGIFFDYDKLDELDK